MAAKKSYSQSKSLYGLKQVEKLWVSINPLKWLNILKAADPNGKWQLKNNTTLQGLCPYHDDNHPSLILTINKRVGKCFASSCGHVVKDLVNLISKIKNCSYAEALTFINSHLSSEDQIGNKHLFSDKFIKEMHEHHQLQELKKNVAVAASELLLDYLQAHAEEDSSKIKEYQYIDAAAEYLFNYRQINPSFVQRMPVGIFGKPIHLKKFLDQKFHKSLEDHFGAYNNDDWWGSLLFHYNDSTNTISAFKLLKADPENNWEKDFRVIKDPDNPTVGVIGMYTFGHIIDRDKEVYITEGEFDFLQMVNKQMEAGENDIIIFGTSGTATNDFSFLANYGVKTIWLVQDHPSKNGDEWALNIFREPKNFRNENGQVNIQFKVFSWPKELIGTDLDEALLQNDYKTVKKFLYYEKSSYFYNHYIWIEDKCANALVELTNDFGNKEEYLRAEANAIEDESEREEAEKKLKIELDNMKDDMYSQIQDIYKYWIKYLHSPSDRRMLTQKMSDYVEIDVNVFDTKTSVYDLNTIDGTAQIIIDALRDHFDFAYSTSTRNEKLLTLWARKRKTQEAVPMGRPARFIDAIDSCIGDWEQFAKKLLGDSEVFTTGLENANSQLDVYTTQKKNFTILMERVIDMIGHEFYDINNLEEFGQGIHYTLLPDELKKKNIVYFVNGDQVFKGRYTDDETVEWENLDKLVDEQRIIFKDLSLGKRWSSVTTIEDLYRSEKIDQVELFNKVRQIVDGWKFRFDSTMKDFLAAYILCHPIMTATMMANLIFVTGEHHSGKTSLVKGLLGGIHASHSVPTVLETAYTYDNVSKAGLYQSHDKASIGITIDEQENDGGGNQTRDDHDKQELLKLFPNIPYGYINLRRGTQSGTITKDYRVHCPIILAGINPPSDVVFMSRVFSVATQKSGDVISQENYIRGLYSAEEIEYLRKDITLAFLSKLPKVKRRASELKREIEEEGINGEKVMDRFLTITLGPLTVYDMVGGDAKRLFRELYEANREKIESMKSEKSYNDIIETLLFKKSVNYRNEDGIYEEVSAHYLIEFNDIDYLNKVDAGIVIDLEEDLMIVDWKKAKYGILENTPFGKNSVNALKTKVNKLPYSVTPTSKMMSRLKNKGMVRKQAKVLDLSFIRFSEIGQEQDPMANLLPDANSNKTTKTKKDTETTDSKQATGTDDLKDDSEEEDDLPGNFEV